MSSTTAPAPARARRSGLRLTGFWMIFVLGTMGIKWIPVASVGPISLEIHNLATLMTMALLGLHLTTRRTYRLPPILLILIALNVWLFFLVRIHNGITFDGIILSLPAVLASIVLCNLSRDWLDHLASIALLSSAVFWVLMFYSANAAGIDLIGDFLSYIATQDRGYFIFQTLRPIFNAFSGPVDPGLEPVYAGSNMNHMASAVYIYLALCMAVIARDRAHWSLYALAGIQAAFLLIVFSSTVMMAVFFAFGVAAVMALRARQHVLVWLGMIATVTAATFALAPAIVEIIAFNIIADGDSASSRGEQYVGALGVINDHPLLGDGIHSFGGHAVHNLFLSSWMLSGLPGALLVLSAYALAFRMMLQGVRALLRDTERKDMALLLLLMPPIFIIRTNFTGGGGMATGVETTALVLAILARYKLLETASEAPTPSGTEQPQ